MRGAEDLGLLRALLARSPLRWLPSPQLAALLAGFAMMAVLKIWV